MKRWFIRLILLVVVMGGIGYAVGEPVMSALRPSGAAQLTTGEALTVSTVGRGDIFRYMTASGNLQPIRRVDLRFSTSGRIEEVHVKAGDRVAAGAELVRLDNRQQELAYAKAKTNYEIARIDSPPNVIQEREYDMDMAWETLERTILRAPFAGLITDVRVEAGQTIGTTDIILHIIDDSGYKVDVSIDELDIAQLSVGQSATVTLDADRSRRHAGFVESIGWVANISQNMVTIPVTVRLERVDPSLRPGYTSTVQIAVAEARNVVRVPVEAINNQSGANLVTKMIDGEPVAVAVQTGITDGVWIEIRSGLEAGDHIVGLNYRGSSGRSSSGGNQLQDLLNMRGITGGAIPFGGGGAFGGSVIRR